jgi:hypothetical protein
MPKTGKLFQLGESFPAEKSDADGLAAWRRLLGK